MNTTKIYNWGIAHRHPIFLVGLISFFITPEVFEKVFFITLHFKLLISILIITSIPLIQTSQVKRYWSYGLISALIIFIIVWNRSLDSENSALLEKIAYFLLFTYFSFISYYLFRDLTRSQKITPSVIIGAFAGYFMIGVIFFFIYAFLDLAYPDTISVDMLSEAGVEDMFYFSFITLTTIGYGDFSPISALGQKIAILQGLIGQFYIAIVMAVLVGKYLSAKQES